MSEKLDRNYGLYLGDGRIISLVRSLIRDRLTLSGRTVFYLLLLANLVGGVSFAVKSYFITSALFGLLLLSVIAARWARVALQLDWDVPSRVTRGVPFLIHFRLTNPGPRAARDVALWPKLPHWARLEPEEGAFFPWIGPGQVKNGRIGVTFKRRGHYIVSGARQATLFPFGLWRDYYDHEASRALLVYPDFHPLQNLDIPVGRRYQPGGIALTSHLGDSTEFLCTREYREGDSVRMIHWRSWARLGVPIVKQFQEEFFCRIALVMDTFLESATAALRRPEFEAAVTLAAALADNLAREEYVIDLFAAGPELYTLQAGRSLAHFENVMDILACVEPCLEPAFEKVEPVLLDSLENITTAVVLLLGWDSRRERLIEAIRERGCAVKAILVCENLEPAQAAHLQAHAGEFVWITPQQIEAGVEQL